MKMVWKVLLISLLALCFPLLYGEKKDEVRENVKERTGKEQQPDIPEEELQNTGIPNVAQPHPKSVEKTAKKEPDIVTFGVYPVGLYDLDPSHDSFKISFYAWWKTHNPDYHPEKSIEITNASHYYSKFGEFGKNGDEYFTYVHYYATLQHDWDVTYFPFDRQILDVRLEDFADIQSVVFKPDMDQSAIHPELTLKGWKILGIKLKESTTHYLTNFGDSSTPQGLYSRITFLIEIKREGWRLFFDYFVGFFISVLLCLLTCFVDFRSIETRATMILGAIFAFVGNKYILNAVLPQTSIFTYVDVVQTATLIIIILAVMNNIILTSNFLIQKFGQKKLQRFEIIYAVSAGLCFVLVVAVATAQSVLS